MSQKPDEIKASPLVPVLQGIQLEIDGEFRTFAFRFDFLANHLVAKEERRLGSEYDQFMSVAVMVKHYLWPRDHGLTIEQILAGISYEQMIYITAKVEELLRLNNVEISRDPTKGLALVPTKRSRTNSSTRSGGNSKPRPGSASGSASRSSGTQRLIN